MSMQENPQKRGTLIHNASFRHVVACAFLIACVLAVFLPMIDRMVNDYPLDHRPHITEARKLAATKAVPQPHFLYHALLLGTDAILPTPDLFVSAQILLAALYVFLAIVLFRLLYAEFAPDSGKAFLCAAATLIIMLAGPIVAFAPIDRHLYFGYLPINAYHSPTMLLLKPLAILLFWHTARIFSEKSDNRLWMYAATALLAVLSLLAKPSYSISLLPAVAVMLAFAYVVKNRSDVRLAAAGLFVPSAIVLAWQYNAIYGENHLLASSKIIFAPFAVFLGWAPRFLFMKFIFSVLFPMAVLVLYFKEALRDRKLVFSWVVFLVGAFYSYFLSETGFRRLHGNFTWSGQITLFVLFFTSMALFLRVNKGPSPHESQAAGGKAPQAWKAACCVAILTLHVAGGLAWHYFTFISKPYEWW